MENSFIDYLKPISCLMHWLKTTFFSDSKDSQSSLGNCRLDTELGPPILYLDSAKLMNPSFMTFSKRSLVVKKFWLSNKICTVISSSCECIFSTSSLYGIWKIIIIDYSHRFANIIIFNKNARHVIATLLVSSFNSAPSIFESVDILISCLQQAKSVRIKKWVSCDLWVVKIFWILVDSSTSIIGFKD